MFTSFVLASFRGSMYGTEYDSPLCSLRPRLRKGASLGEELVLADLGRAGGVAAGVARVRSPAILNILRGRSCACSIRNITVRFEHKLSCSSAC